MRGSCARRRCSRRRGPGPATGRHSGWPSPRAPERRNSVARHIVGIPSWYRSARGSGGGYFRDQALALQAAGYRVAMLAPDIYTLRDLRHGRVPPQFGRAVRVEDDGIPTWRRETLVLAPRLPYRNAAMLALCGLQLF